MNSSWLFWTHGGQARLKSKANTLHTNVYREKEEAVLQARPYWMQTNGGGPSWRADRSPNWETRDTSSPDGPSASLGLSASLWKQRLRPKWPQKCPFPKDRSRRRAVACFPSPVCRNPSLVPNVRPFALLVWGPLEEDNGSFKGNSGG